MNSIALLLCLLAAYRKLAGKELAEDATFELERRRNRPEKYDREVSPNIMSMLYLATIALGCIPITWSLLYPHQHMYGYIRPPLQPQPTLMIFPCPIMCQSLLLLPLLLCLTSLHSNSWHPALPSSTTQVVAKTVKAMQRIDEIRVRRQERFYEKRMQVCTGFA